MDIRNNIRRQGITSALRCIVGLLIFATSSSWGASTPPNIVYILADDMGIGDVTAFNANSKIATPHLDQLANEGMRLTDVHTNSAVCTPTRYGILTGRYAWRSRLKNGVTKGHSDHLITADQETVASLLKKQGYATAVVGKWHLGMDWTSTDGLSIKPAGKNVDLSAALRNGPNSVGFDYYFGISASLNMNPHAYIENDRILGEFQFLADKEAVKAAGLISAKEGWMAKDFKQNQVMTTLIDKSIGWIENQQKRNPQQPFFLYLPLNAPHSPIVPSPEFVDKSKLSPHGDFVMEVDYQVGRIAAALEEMNVASNTLFIFTADNGVSPMAKLDNMQQQGHYSSGQYRGLKGSLYEGGHRVPFIARWPGQIPTGSSSDYHASTTDLMATIADITDTDLNPATGVDSISMLPVLQGKSVEDEARGGVVYHSDSGRYAIRRGPWKLILHESGGTRRKNPKDEDQPVLPAGERQLFNMDQDPTERTNLQATHPEIADQLTRLLASYINNGRSTEGPRQTNEKPVGKKKWPGLELLAPYLDS
ncbi:MAG: arylsulfatase [Pseudomonadales bacterium]